MSGRTCRIVLPVVLLALCGLSAPFARAGEPATSDLVERGHDLYRAGRYQEARNVLVRALEAEPDHARAAKLLNDVSSAIRREQLAIYRMAAEQAERRAGGEPVRADAAKSPPERDLPSVLPPRDEPSDRVGDPADLEGSVLYDRAEALVRRGDYDAARKVLAMIDPGDRDAFERARLLAARIEAWEARRPDEGVGPDELDAFVRERLERDYRRALHLFNQGRWAECIAVCRRIREFAPHDERVRKLYRDARMEYTAEAVREAAAEGELATFEMLERTERMASPDVPDVRIPRPDYEPDVRVLSPEQIELEKKLNEKVSMDLIDAPLSYVLDLLARAVGLNLIVDPVAVEGRNITINVQNTSVREVLDFITRSANITYARTRSAVYITTPDQPMLELRTIRLSKGLTDTLHNVVVGGGGDVGGGGGGMPSESSDIERLMQVIELGLIDWPQGSRYYLDRKRNILFLRSTPEVCDQVEEMVQTLDENPVQVKVTTRFIEVSAEDFDELGVDWNITADYPLSKRGGVDALVIDAGTGTTFDRRVGTTAGDTVSHEDGLRFHLTGILTNPQFQATMRTLQSQYKGRVVTAPSVTATSNSPARFIESQDLWYVDDYRIDRTDLTYAEGVETSEPVVVPVFARDASTGFSLTVTPSVGRDSRDISLLIEPIFRRRSIDSITQPVILPEGLRYDEDIIIERPVVVDRRLNVKVTVRDGYHVVLGGMIDSEKQDIETKVPILGDIPLLGWFFRRRTTRDVRKNLIIIVSARILDSRGYKYLTEEEEAEQARRVSAIRGRERDPGELPEGIGFENIESTETRHFLGPSDPRVREPDIIELQEFDD